MTSELIVVLQKYDAAKWYVFMFLRINLRLIYS